MSKLVFEELYLFSCSEKKAKVITFSPLKNVITSSAVDGTDRGKSVIMKSLYHTLGADCYFEDKWNDSEKTYVLSFSVDKEHYYILRHDKLFKIFNGRKKLIYTAVSRHELANDLNEIFHFAVKLPQRPKNDEEGIGQLEIASPAYNYLLYYLDQDKQGGSQFLSFKRLSEYPDFKENVLYYHLGVFDDSYYRLVQQQEQVSAKVNQLRKEQEMICMMLDKVYENLKDVSYSKDIEHLRADINRTKREYNRIAQNLSDIRKKLIQLRNDKADLVYHLQALNLLDKENEKQIASLNKHICPLCNSFLDNPMSLRVRRYNTGDDIFLITNDLQYDIETVDRKIADLETQYDNWLSKLKTYEESINIKSSEINDVLAHRGYIEIKERVSDDLHATQTALRENENVENGIKKELKKYSDAKKKINERYYSLMLADKERFGLEGIDAKSFENIKRNFSAGGSNNPISTIIWYVNLIQLKHDFNPDSIDFPIVLDSPNNAETDEEKKALIYDYICERINGNQLIVSGIGLLSSDVESRFDKVITLTNGKYELLCSEDYEKHINFLAELDSQY